MSGDETKTDAFWIFSRKSEYAAPEFRLVPQPYADYYKMDHPRRGMAIIFNQEHFQLPECPTRDGTDKDRDGLQEALLQLQFDVKVYNDLTVSEIKDTLFTVSKMDHSPSDCILIVFMSHGDNGVLYARDASFSTNTLWKTFSAKECPSLIGKPKLFFIQACRGQGLDEGVTVKYDVDQTDSSVEENFYTLPTMADILVMYSTPEGFYSWRSPKHGTIFIQSLVNQLSELAYQRDLLTILTFVNRQVAVEFTSYEPEDPQLNKHKQMCTIVSMLTRMVFFTKK